jgi:hypothetical protein
VLIVLIFTLAVGRRFAENVRLSLA